MDFVEILVVLLFLGVPLLGRVLGGGGSRPPTLPPPPAAGGETPAGLPAPARVDFPAPVGGWHDWPSDEDGTEEGDALDEVAADHDLDVDSIHTAEALSLEPIAASEGVVRALPAAVPVVLDSTDVDRAAEHERFHRKVAGHAAPAPRADRPADHLRSRGEVRRALLLGEVLGPPRSLRGPDGR